VTVTTKRPSPSGTLVLSLLLLAYIFNFLDRQILGILAQPIQADLNLTDTEFGAIGGLAFALLYSVLAVPLGEGRFVVTVTRVSPKAQRGARRRARPDKSRNRS
jgi:hypothetical protein